MWVQARVAKYIACEEEWLRLLVQELTPVMEHLQDQELPLSEPSSTSHMFTMQSPTHSIILLHIPNIYCSSVKMLQLAANLQKRRVARTYVAPILPKIRYHSQRLLERYRRWWKLVLQN